MNVGSYHLGAYFSSSKPFSFLSSLLSFLLLFFHNEQNAQKSKNPGPKDLALPLAPRRGANSWPPEEASRVVPASPLPTNVT